MSTTGAPTVVICDREPVALAGFRVLLSGCEDLALSAAETSIIRTTEAVRKTSPPVLAADGEIGIHTTLERVQTTRRECSPRSAAAIWCRQLSADAASQLTEVGATGFLSKYATAAGVLSGGSARRGTRARGQKSGFTPRERQILELL